MDGVRGDSDREPGREEEVAGVAVAVATAAMMEVYTRVGRRECDIDDIDRGREVILVTEARRTMYRQ